MPGDYSDSVERQARRQTSIRRVMQTARKHEALATRQRDIGKAAEHRRAAEFWWSVVYRMRQMSGK